MTVIELAGNSTVIVGAGPAGLAVGAVLKQAGLESVILERADHVGARWYQHYERLHLHTAKQFSALPLLPFPADYPRYPSRQQVIDYLDAYAKHFKLDIRFNQSVQSADYQAGKWLTQTQDSSYQSQNLVVATGINDTPNLPTWTGQEQFSGKIMHSADYQNGEQFRGQQVLVIGFGNSGGEIAIDLHEHGAIPSVAVRSPVNVVFRDYLGLPAQQISILLSPLPSRIADSLTALSRYMAYGDITRYGLRKLPYGPVKQMRDDQQIPVIDVGVIQLIREGKVKVHPGVREFMADGVIFSDGVSKHFDAIILATGYRGQAGALFKDASKLTNNAGEALVSGQQTALKGLYYCGFRNAATGLLREIGIEAQRIGKQIAQSSV
ncbi:MAG: NAD(P)/FAD-dependent oxidoreductase [Anaerolineae bacterium]|nr:NAD(P)/FAD-dependent oxidoreductase [Anaerolineae bacterium]